MLTIAGGILLAGVLYYAAVAVLVLVVGLGSGRPQQPASPPRTGPGPLYR